MAASMNRASINQLRPLGSMSDKAVLKRAAAKKAAAKASSTKLKDQLKPLDESKIKGTQKNNKPVKGSVAKTFDINKLIPQMTAQDKAMLKILQQKYGKNVYKG
jgi:hypothetical protein